MLKSPGARELMDEEVKSWQRNIDSKHVTRNQMAVSGSFVLRGNPSPAQRFNRGKLVRCNVRQIGGGQFAAERSSCDLLNPVYIPLSANGVDTPTAVAPGYYLLGFENSMSPGMVQIQAGQTTAVDLQTIPVPAGGTVKIYRDLTALTEQFKLYFATYVLDDSLFSLAEYSYGDLYIKTFGVRDGAPQLNYSFCESAKLPEMTVKGARVCKAWNMGTFMTVTEMFNFGSDGSFTQWGINSPGKPYNYKFGRLLVARRTTSAVSSFVNVLPGQYMVEVTSELGSASQKSTGPVGPNVTNQSAMNLGWLPPAAKLSLEGNSSAAPPAAIDPLTDQSTAQIAAQDKDGGDDFIPKNETCGNAARWRTEFRAYCSHDSQAGCNRSTAKMCEPMHITPEDK